MGELEFSPCKRMTVASPDGVQRARIGVSAGLRVPVYQESFMRIAVLNPTIGFRRRPINLAIKEALEYLYRRQPRGFETAKAV
ncbi:MAG: hypothetical protein JW786_00395 [Desulfobacterales bacterium]|nr:hypothetical protein [Desulfobacterales bacterium]